MLLIIGLWSLKESGEIEKQDFSSLRLWDGAVSGATPANKEPGTASATGQELNTC